MTLQLRGRVAATLVGLDARSLVTTRQPEARVTFEGFAGDRHAGLTRPSDSRTPHYPRGTEIRNSRQVSLVSSEELAVIAALLGIPLVLPEWLGANILVAGIPHLTQIPPSTRLFFAGGAVLVVDSENRPCIAPGKVIEAQHSRLPGIAARFVASAQGRRGIVAWVERPGAIREGDEMRAEVPHQVLYSQ